MRAACSATVQWQWAEVALAAIMQRTREAGIAITNQGRGPTGGLELQLDAVASVTLLA